MEQQAKKVNKMAIGENLRRLRKEKGLQQTELAELAGISNSYISKIEKGTTEPTYTHIKRLVIALETTADKLLFDETEREPSDELKIWVKKAETHLNRRQIETLKDMIRGWITACTNDNLRDQ